MQRSIVLVAAVLCSCLAALAAPGAATADAPAEADVWALAEGYGLACEEREFFEGQMRDIQCRRDAGPDGEPPTLTVTYAPPGSPILDIQVSLFGQPPLPTDWNDIAIDLAELGCDADREEIAAAMPDDDGSGETDRRQNVGTCGIDYTATDLGDGYVDRRITIYLEQVPDSASQPPSSSIPVASPIAPPADWSVDGRSEYTGVWTLTAMWSDRDTPLGEEVGVGDSAEGKLVIDCRGPEPACLVTGDGLVGDAWEAEVIGNGAVRGVREYELPLGDADCSPKFASTTETLDASFDAAHATAVNEEVTNPRSCETADGDQFFLYDATFEFDGVLTAYQGPDSTAVPAVESRGDPTTGDESFASSIPRPTAVSSDPTVLLQSALLAALFVFLMPFPSQLFNSTLEEHENEVRRWLRLDRLGRVTGGIGAFWSSWIGVSIFTLLAALLYGFLDPGFSLDFGSLATFLGMLLGIVLVTIVFAVPAILIHRRHGDRPGFKVVPVSLLIGVACVVLSRVTSFQPGYLYGLLIGLAFARELSEAEEGRATAIGAALMLVVAFSAWMGLGILPEGESFGLSVARTVMAALMVAGLEGVVFGLLPMRFLPGETLFAWNRILWAGLLLIGAFAFFHILINPTSGYLSDTSRTPLFTVIGLLAGFSLVSVAFWAWFRFRPERPSSALDA